MKSKNVKRREKRQRRKDRNDWGSTHRRWDVTLRLDGKRVSVEAFCPSPMEAAESVMMDNREYIIKNISVDRTRVEVRHDHYGLVLSEVMAVPPEPVPDPEQEEKPDDNGRISYRRIDGALRASALAIMENRRRRIIGEAAKEMYEIGTGIKGDPEFEFDDTEGLPKLSFFEEE